MTPADTLLLNVPEACGATLEPGVRGYRMDAFLASFRPTLNIFIKVLHSRLTGGYHVRAHTSQLAPFFEGTEVAPPTSREASYLSLAHHTLVPG